MTNANAIITGASRGLGLALARALSAEGWNLILTARGERALNDAASSLEGPGAAISVAGDVTDPAHRAAVADAARQLGGLDAVVNNASSLGPSPLPPLLELDPADLTALFAVNAAAPLALIQDLHRAEALRDGLRVLNLSSDAAVEAYAGWGGYGASKSALDHISAVLGRERASWRVYAVDPGDMRTQMHQDAFPGQDISDRPLPQQSVPGLIRLLCGDLPSGRYRARALDAEGV